MDTTFVFWWLNPILLTTKLSFYSRFGRFGFEIQNVCLLNAKPLWRFVFKIPKVARALIKLQDTCSKSVWGHHSGHSILKCITWRLRPRIQDDFDHWRGWQPWCMCDGVEASYWSASSDAGFWLAAYWHGDGHILRFDRWEVSLFITENRYTSM